MDICLYCKKQFIAKRTTKRKYCSYICYWESLKDIPSKKRNGKILGCSICKRTFYLPPYRLKKINYCSNECRSKSLIGKRISPKTEFKKGMVPWNKGKKCPRLMNEKNANWKGDKVSYYGLHCWVKRHKDHPKICVKCGSKKNMQWANKDHKYRRNTQDYISLCSSCHKLYDIKYNNSKLPKRNRKSIFIPNHRKSL